MGLTSAATIWVVAAIGSAVGAGLYIEALGAGVVVTLVLSGMGPFEHRLRRARRADRHRSCAAKRLVDAPSPRPCSKRGSAYSNTRPTITRKIAPLNCDWLAPPASTKKRATPCSSATTCSTPPPPDDPACARYIAARRRYSRQTELRPTARARSGLHGAHLGAAVRGRDAASLAAVPPGWRTPGRSRTYQLQTAMDLQAPAPEVMNAIAEAEVYFGCGLPKARVFLAAQAASN